MQYKQPRTLHNIIFFKLNETNVFIILLLAYHFIDCVFSNHPCVEIVIRFIYTAKLKKNVIIILCHVFISKSSLRHSEVTGQTFY